MALHDIPLKVLFEDLEDVEEAGPFSSAIEPGLAQPKKVRSDVARGVRQTRRELQAKGQKGSLANIKRSQLTPSTKTLTYSMQRKGNPDLLKRTPYDPQGRI